MFRNNIVATVIEFGEKILLITIALATAVAAAQEVTHIVQNEQVELGDLLLLFLHTEVLGMVGVFYKSRRIPITLPLFIAITALCRLILLQGKDLDPKILLYESGAIVLIAVAVFIIRYRSPDPGTKEQNGAQPDD